MSKNMDQKDFTIPNSEQIKYVIKEEARSLIRVQNPSCVALENEEFGRLIVLEAERLCRLYERQKFLHHTFIQTGVENVLIEAAVKYSLSADIESIVASMERIISNDVRLVMFYKRTADVCNSRRQFDLARVLCLKMIDCVLSDKWSEKVAFFSDAHLANCARSAIAGGWCDIVETCIKNFANADSRRQFIIEIAYATSDLKMVDLGEEILYLQSIV